MKDKPAFPYVFEQSQNSDGTWNQTTDVESGMTLREYYAGLAMQGFISSGREIDYAGERHLPTVANIANLSTKFADALIEELEKK